ncbi:MAG: DUF4397 domain-containing protein [Woeseiaceae bacterium]|nr:DUF4397 domain-containing protein [Woeseiaceae bacterium]
MKKLFLVFTLFALAACAEDSSFPTPTGKGTIRALNAIPGSPGIEFNIEQRFLGTVNHREATTGTAFDDFEYEFNFFAFFLTDNETRQIASQRLKVDANVDYTLVLTGDIDSPDIAIWAETERDFDGSETAFSARFAHTAPSVGAVDIYLAADGVAPVLGEERGTLNFGETLPPADVAEGEYVMTVTTAGDPADILYQSTPTTYVPLATLIFAIFDTDNQDTGQLVARLINSGGTTAALPDATAPVSIRFYQASQDLANADVYDDEMIMNQILQDHAYLDVTDDIEYAAGTLPLTYTTVGDTSAILFESGITTVAGFRYSFVVIGREGERFGQVIVPDRRSISTLAKIRPYHAAFNNVEVDVYVVPTGTVIDEVDPNLPDVVYSLLSPSIGVADGSYDIYLTLPDEKTIISGPLNVTVALGDVVELLFYDAVDPAVIDMRIIPPSP